MTMSGEIIVRFTITSLCNPEDLIDAKMTFEEMVREEIQCNDLLDVVDEGYEIIEVKEVT